MGAMEQVIITVQHLVIPRTRITQWSTSIPDHFAIIAAVRFLSLCGSISRQSYMRFFDVY